MNTKSIKLSVFLAAVVVLCVAGTKVSRLTRTTTIQGDSLFMVVTGSVANGTTATRAIEATNLVSELSGLPNWPAGNGGGTPSYVLTNNQSSPSRLAASLKVDGAFTNAGAFYAALLASNSVPQIGAAGVLTNRSKHYHFETNASPILSNLVSATTSGDVVELGAGTFNVGTQTILIPQGVTLKGEGMYSTVISGTVGYATNLIVVPSSSCVVEDLSIVNAAKNSYHAGAFGLFTTVPHPAATNVIVRNVYAEGGSDCVWLAATNYFEVKFYDCFFKSSWDTFIQSYAGSGAASSNYVELWNCTLLADKRGSTYSTGYSGANNSAKAFQIAGTARLFNCDLISTNSNFGWGVKMDAYADVVMVGGSVRAAGTNTAYVLDNINTTWAPETAPFRIYGTAINPVYQASGSVITHPDGYYTNLTALGALTVSGATALGSSLDVSGTTTLNGVFFDGTVNFTGLTPSKALALNSSGNVITVTGSGTYVKADGTTGDPAGAGTMTTIKTNGVNVSTSAGSLNFIYGSNTVVRTTNTAGAVDIHISATGAGSGTNLVSAGNTNATDLSLVYQGTNSIGAVKSVRGGFNTTITERGATNVAIDINTNITLKSAQIGTLTNDSASYFNGSIQQDTGFSAQFGSTTTEALQANGTATGPRFNVGQLDVRTNLNASALVLTNTAQVLARSMAVAGTNLVLSGALGNRFTNAIASSGLTNLVFTNLLDGQTIVADMWVTNGTTVQLCTAPGVTFPAAWYLEGSAYSVSTNGFARVAVSRYGNWTNVLIWSPLMDQVYNGTVVTVTNFATRQILLTLHPTLTNLAGLANWVFTNQPAGGTNISVRTVGGTNFIDTTGQLNNWAGYPTNVWNSRQGGAANLTNLANSSIDVPVGNVVSNVTALKWQVHAPAITTSNLTVSFATNRTECVGLTNLVLTNIVEEATGISADASIVVRATTGNIALVWPAYGAQHGYFLRTNVNNYALGWAAVTNGKTAVISFTAYGTNVFATITEWP